MIKYPVVSLFSGGMGLDLGLMQAGLDVVVSQDFNEWCVQTIKRNGHVGVLGDIRKLLDEDPSCRFLLDPAGIEAQEVFAVVGGPPCQAYSTAGKRKGIEDERGSLYKQFVQVIKTIKPRFFVMENVKGLASMASEEGPDVPLLDVILKLFKDCSYHTVHGVLDAVHYGAPQFRERLLIIGSRDNEPIFLPFPTHYHMHQNPDMRWRTLGDAIFDIQTKDMVSMKFSPNIAKYLEHVPPGGNWRDLPENLKKPAMGGAFESEGGKVGFYRRLNFNEPSPTLLTSPIQKATLFCHPEETRPLSVEEYARIQCFPDDWILEGNTQECYRQIGNAVPIPLAKAIGQMLKSVADKKHEVKVKRMRGTSVHSQMFDFGKTLSGASDKKKK